MSQDFDLKESLFFIFYFFFIRPSSRLLPVLGPLEGVHDSYTWSSPAYLALGRVLIWVGRCIVDPSLDLMNSRHFRHIVRLLQLLYVFTSQLSVRYRKLLHPAPYYLNSDKVCLLLSDQYRSPERDSNPPYQSEQPTWIRLHALPPSHHGWIKESLIADKKQGLKLVFN